jgi:hypothetical protein
MSSDRTLFRQFVIVAHSAAVGGAVNSDSEPETCMEATEVFPDTNAKLVLVPGSEYEGQSESWLRRHADYIERTAECDNLPLSREHEQSLFRHGRQGCERIAQVQRVLRTQQHGAFLSAFPP